jgi:hypothetical protein
MPTTSRSRTEAAAGDMLAAALDYADQSWPVFACEGKRPRTRNGCLDATTDRATIEGWWARWPSANVAVATSDTLAVVDVDGETGGDSLRDLERAHEELPPTVCALTGSGNGCHYYFTTTSPVLNSAGTLGPGLDVRGLGGYVIAPPSLHRSGRRYAWDTPPGEAEVAPMPRWLLGLLTKTPSALGRAAPVSEWRQLAAGGAELGRRNNSCARIAGHLLARKVDPYVVLELVAGWDQTKNRPPLGRDEVQRTVESIAKAEARRRR